MNEYYVILIPDQKPIYLTFYGRHKLTMKQDNREYKIVYSDEAPRSKNELMSVASFFFHLPYIKRYGSRVAILPIKESDKCYNGGDPLI